jgi:hypothetical protein
MSSASALRHIALPDLALALDIGRPGFEAPDMKLLQLQFGSVLNGDQALFAGDEAGQGVKKGGLAGAGTAGDDQRNPAAHRRLQQFGHRRAQRADVDQAIDVEWPFGELANRHQRPVDRDRADGDVDARTVRQARVDHGRGLIDPPTDAGDDLIDDAQQVRLILEADIGALQPAVTLDEA